MAWNGQHPGPGWKRYDEYPSYWVYHPYPIEVPDNVVWMAKIGEKNRHFDNSREDQPLAKDRWVEFEYPEYLEAQWQAGLQVYFFSILQEDLWISHFMSVLDYDSKRWFLREFDSYGLTLSTRSLARWKETSIPPCYKFDYR